MPDMGGQSRVRLNRVIVDGLATDRATMPGYKNRYGPNCTISENLKKSYTSVSIFSRLCEIQLPSSHLRSLFLEFLPVQFTLSCVL